MRKGLKKIISVVLSFIVVSLTILYCLNGYNVYVSPIFVSVYSICASNEFASSEEVRFFAEMQEIKTVKLTYIQVDGVYAYGRHTESSFVRFSNRILPNLPLSPKYIDSVEFTRVTQNYNSSDQHAYMNYYYGGHTERVLQHKYGGKNYESKYI